MGAITKYYTDMTLQLDSQVVHAGRSDFSELGVHAPPIDLSSTYPIHDLSSATRALDGFVEGKQDPKNPIYARLYNPTVGRFEEAMSALELTESAVAFSSGMAALTACLLAARPVGQHVVAIRPLYGGSDHLISSDLLGMEVTWTDQDHVYEAIRKDTSLVILETPGNPTLSLIDIPYVVEQAGRVPVLVDSTFATPINQQPAEMGATMVLHSGTKYLGGHGDVVAGVVATSETWARKLRQVRVATGAILHPLAAFLLHRGLATLSVRIEKAQSTARILAQKIKEHPLVDRVYFPGFRECDPRELVGSQMRGPGCMIALELKGGHNVAASVMQHVKLMTPAVSLGSTDTLIQHPAGLTHRVMDPETRESTGISESMLRISVGLENPDDLWADLEHAFETSSHTSAWQAEPVH